MNGAEKNTNATPANLNHPDSVHKIAATTEMMTSRPMFHEMAVSEANNVKKRLVVITIGVVSAAARSGRNTNLSQQHIFITKLR